MSETVIDGDKPTFPYNDPRGIRAAIDDATLDLLRTALQPWLNPDLVDRWEVADRLHYYTTKHGAVAAAKALEASDATPEADQVAAQVAAVATLLHGLLDGPVPATPPPGLRAVPVLRYLLDQGLAPATAVTAEADK